jgi:glycosyltransferase involved in cell wall biosynthesis
MVPKISIITPSYNQGQYIEQTIQSIVSQNYPNLEYIIIDGGSTDNTVEIIKKYEKYIAYWVSEPDKGQSDAINKGIARATGDVFNWINSDDYLAPGALELVCNYFTDKKVDVLCTPTQLFNEQGNIRVNSYTRANTPLYELLNSTGLNQQGMYWRMDKIKKLNGVNTSFKYSMDLDLWKRFLLTYGNDNCIVEDTITAFFRLHGNSKTGNDFDVNFSFFEKENNAALRQYARLAGNNYLKGIEYLYPLVDEKLSLIKPVSELPVETIKKWLNQLFYNKAMRAFYAEKFKDSYLLTKCIDAEYLTGEQEKNTKSFLRWSFVKRFMPL